jgi:exosortase D (VPLPA-CTERM-specific)
MITNSVAKYNFTVWVSFALLLGAFCFQYHVDFGNLLKRWNEQDFTYCYLVPVLFVYLVYINRQSLKAVEMKPSITGAVILLVSAFLYLAGKLGSLETLTYIGMWLGIIGLTTLLFGHRITKALAFPFLILGFIVPVPAFLNRLFTFKLKLIASSLSVKLLQFIGVSVFREGNVIDLGINQLQMVDACSGLRYVYPLLLMGLLFAYFLHRQWWQRGLIVAATVPIAVISNAIRIAVTGLLTVHVSPEVAAGFFHGFSGWLIFMVSLLFLLIMSFILKFLGKKQEKGTVQPTHQLNNESNFTLRGIKIKYLLPTALFFLIVWGLHTTLASTQIVPSRKKFDEFPAKIAHWKGKRTYLQEEIMRELWADDYLQIQFNNTTTGDVVLLFVPYYEYQGTRHTAHSPVSCLVGGGFAPRSTRILTRTFPEPFREVRIRQMVLEKGDQLLLSNYWFQQRGRVIVSEYSNKWHLFLDSLTKRRTDGALVRLEMPLSRRQSVKEAQDVMDSFTQQLMKILPEYVPG